MAAHVDFRNKFEVTKEKKVMSMLIQIAAFAAIGVASIALTPQKQPDCGTTALSMGYVIISGVFSALYGQASMMYGKVKVHPLIISSVEGMVGLIEYLIALPFLSYFHLETPSIWAKQHATWYIILNQILFLSCVFTVTSGGYLCGKFANTVSFQAIEAARPTLVMIVSLFCGFEKFDIEFFICTISAQLLLILGFIMYN